MNSETYHFKIGAFECIAVSDGIFKYAPPTFPPPAKFLFNKASKDDLEKTLGKHNLQPESWTEWISPYICLLVNTGEHLVLVDTGANGLDPNTGRLIQNLKSEGIAADDIDMVIITHCHPDHINGNTLEDGQLTFPNATYVMWKSEWDFWTSGEAEAKLDEHFRDVLMGVVSKNLPPIQDRLELIDHERDILPGIQAISAPGHTPGHMALRITSEGEQLLDIVDTVLHPIHIERPEWCASTDFIPDQVVATRRRLLHMAESDKSLVLAFHFPFPGLGHVIRKGDEWEWQPIEI